MSNPKFKVGDKVFCYRWKSIKQGTNETILAIVPKRWWQFEYRYAITFASDFPAVAKEKDLALLRDETI